jgi:hypothetical protein
MTRRTHRTIEVSRVVGRTFRIWFRTLPQLLLVTLLAHAPLIAAKYWLRDAGNAGDWRGAVARALPIVELFAMSAIVEAFAVLMVFQRLRGEPIDLGRSIAIGFRRIGAVLGIAAILNAPSVAANLLGGGRESGGQLAAAVAIAIANLVIALVYCVPTPVALVERCGVFASLRRSRDLTRGNRGTIFGTYIVFGIALVVFGLVAALFDFSVPAWADFAAEAAADLVVASIFCVFPIVLYHELRESKEGIGIDELAAVFD